MTSSAPPPPCEPRKLSVDIKVHLDCPFCGGLVSAGFDQEGNGVVLHSMPFCKTFERKTPHDFLQAVRCAKEGSS